MASRMVGAGAPRPRNQSQLCGRLLDQDNKRYRFYARVSPIVCISDVFTFLVVLVLVTAMVVAQNGSPMPMTKFVVGSRRAASDPQAVENTFLVRLVLLIVGAIAYQTVELVAMSGTPWTKPWALMYLMISIIFGEILIFIFIGRRWDRSVAAGISGPLPDGEYPSLWR